MDQEVHPLAEKSKFNSFAQFEKVFEEWKALHGHNFRISSSDLLRGEDEAIFKYKYVVYHCVHYGEPRIRGVGKRPNQSYLSCGCKASLRVVYNPTENALKLVKLYDVHTGHTVTAERKFFPLRQSRFSMGEGPYDEIYQIQYEKVLRLKKDREEMIKNYYKQFKEAGLKTIDFDPPPINKDTLSFYKKALDRGTPFDDQQHKELAELAKKLLEKKMKSMQFE